MIEILFYIIILSVAVLIITNSSNANHGSDHAFHLSTIQRIKNNRHRFIKNYLLSINEKYPFYPQLYHWLLSFLPETVYQKKFNYINLAVKVIEIIVFNIFLYYIYNTIGFERINFLYANIVFNAFPFSYSAWNAKNTGLSARGIGLVAGQSYLYLIVAYLLTGSLWILLSIFFIVFVIMLLSQITMQFVILSLPLVIVVFSVPELFPIPFVAYGLFYLIIPKVAKNYIIGQFNHKRNYALFMANIFILKNRPSIYRDFILDFWVKLRNDWRHGLIYIYTNPLVELVYGFVFLWFVVYANYSQGFAEEFKVIYKLVMISLALFFLTSFRWTRFLGEPQRYVEFGIPAMSFLFAISYSWQITAWLLLFSFLVISAPKILSLKFRRFDFVDRDISNLLTLIKDSGFKNSTIFISNQTEAIKFISGLGAKICRPDVSCFYKSKKDFNKHYYSSYSSISPHAIKEYIDNYFPDYLIIARNIYDVDELSIQGINIEYLHQIRRFDYLDFYKINYC